MKVYKKVANCGPVPYPDGSGKFLTTEHVTGDEWEPFIALGFIFSEEIEDPATPQELPKQDDIKAETSYHNEVKEVTDENGQHRAWKDDRKRSKAVRTPKIGPSDG